MVDAYPVLFRRGVAQHLDDLELGLYKTSGNYTVAESTLARPAISFGPDMPTTYDNAIVLTMLEPLREGRANLVWRIQITTRLKGTKAQAENFAWALFEALDQKQNIPAGFNVSWVSMFSQLLATADTSGRLTTYQTFYFRGRRPLT